MAFIFRYSWASVEAVEPTFGSLMGGTVLRVFGSGFEDTVNIKCMFMPLSLTNNGVVGQQSALVSHSFTFISPSEALCVTPPSPEEGSYEVQVCFLLVSWVWVRFVIQFLVLCSFLIY